MVDYYSVLLRAVMAPDAGDAQWRRSIYDRARQMLARQMHARRPPAPMAEVAAEEVALEGAIEQVESEVSWAARGAITSNAATVDRDGDISTETWIEPERGAIAKPFPLGGTSWIVAAIVAAALGAGGYVFWEQTAQKSAPPAIKNETPSAAPKAARATTATTDGDLAPGIDGGSSDADLPYAYRRQPTFYRTLQPVGTIIIDKPQHFLYLVQPNSVALRYGIGLGQQCADLAGLHRISNKAEWPQWQPPADMIERKLLRPGAFSGGPGNPLGARVLDLDDGKSRINGTNAPKTIGSSVAFGCIRLVNEDIVDLYNRVQVSTPVIAGN
jgi:lipoprotein-anchoring transpeptidase ErfK/SrfK